MSNSQIFRLTDTFECQLIFGPPQHSRGLGRLVRIVAPDARVVSGGNDRSEGICAVPPPGQASRAELFRLVVKSELRQADFEGVDLVGIAMESPLGVIPEWAAAAETVVQSIAEFAATTVHVKKVRIFFTDSRLEARVHELLTKNPSVQACA